MTPLDSEGVDTTRGFCGIDVRADEETLPHPQECEVVEQLVTQRILNEGAFGP